MVEVDNNNYGTPCHNSLKSLVHLAIMQRNVRQSGVKMCLLQILYANPFVGL